MKLVAIEFTASASPYHAGDIAGFEPSLAKAYIDAGVAKPHAGEAKAKKPAKENKPAKPGTAPAVAEHDAELDGGQSAADFGTQQLGE